MAYDTKQAVIGLLEEYIAAEKEIHDKNQQAYAARKTLSLPDEKLKEAGNAASASAFAVRAARNFVDYLEGRKSLENYAAGNELDELSDAVMMFFLEKRKECEFHFVAKQVYVHKLQGDFSETEKRTAIDGLHLLARIGDKEAISALEQAVSDLVVGGAVEKKLNNVKYEKYRDFFDSTIVSYVEKLSDDEGKKFKISFADVIGTLQALATLKQGQVYRGYYNETLLEDLKIATRFVEGKEQKPEKVIFFLNVYKEEIESRFKKLFKKTERTKGIERSPFEHGWYDKNG